ncbi:DUF397 domain-containing protein [Streptomyces sp. NPDC056373]|uniref:DUF397 domain-containing protein n=1 Tax=Streptomyces sp. NPDC056373 TaxID=3345798 RepID=UPI0035E30FEB
MTTELAWFKSSYSSNDGPDCVEVAIPPAHSPAIHIRDSKNKDGSRLSFTGGAWSEFLRSAAEN